MKIYYFVFWMMLLRRWGQLMLYKSSQMPITMFLLVRCQRKNIKPYSGLHVRHIAQTSCLRTYANRIGSRTLEHAKSITKYIYNHGWVLSLMRRHTQGRELARPTVTRFATHFLTLQSLICERENLEKMFSSNEGNLDKTKKTPKRKFWKACFGKKQQSF